MRVKIASILIVGTMLTPHPASANDQALYEGAQTYQNAKGKAGIAGVGQMGHDLFLGMASLLGFQSDLDRWKEVNAPEIRRILSETGLPGVLVGVPRQRPIADVGSSQLVGGRAILMGAGLDPRSVAKSRHQEGSFDADPQVSSGYQRDRTGSEYLWVQEKDGKLVWGSIPASRLDEDVRFDLANEQLMSDFAKRYDGEAAARVVDHLARNDADEALRREAMTLSAARIRALEEAQRINDELKRALEREREANAAAASIQTWATIGNIAGSVVALAKQFPERKPDIDQAVASGSKENVGKVVDEIRREAKSAADASRSRSSDNTTNLQAIRRSEQWLLEKRRIPKVVPGVMFGPQPTSDAGPPMQMQP
jgi:hypothetical protein